MIPTDYCIFGPHASVSEFTLMNAFCTKLDKDTVKHVNNVWCFLSAT